MKRSLLILFCAYAAVASALAQQDTLSLPDLQDTSSMLALQDTPSLDSDMDYTLPTSVRDTILLGDSVIVIHTVCAPICSSRVRVLNKEGVEMGILRPPFRSAFPEAYIEDGKLLWRDNDPFDYTPIR
jgi:hypothetical protein